MPLAGLSDLGGADPKSARHCFPGLRGGVDTHSWGRSVLGQPGPVHLLLFCHQHLVIPPVVHFANTLSLCQPLSYGLFLMVCSHLQQGGWHLLCPRHCSPCLICAVTSDFPTTLYKRCNHHPTSQLRPPRPREIGELAQDHRDLHTGK